MKTSLTNPVITLMLMLSASLIVCADVPDGLVDPTRPLTYTEGSLYSLQQGLVTDFVLTSVIIRKNVRAAVINGERVVENQMVGGAMVISIRPGQVTLHQGDQRLELNVHHANVRQATDQ